MYSKNHYKSKLLTQICLPYQYFINNFIVIWYRKTTHLNILNNVLPKEFYNFIATILMIIDPRLRREFKLYCNHDIFIETLIIGIQTKGPNQMDPTKWTRPNGPKPIKTTVMSTHFVLYCIQCIVFTK